MDDQILFDCIFFFHCVGVVFIYIHIMLMIGYLSEQHLTGF